MSVDERMRLARALITLDRALTAAGAPKPEWLRQDLEEAIGDLEYRRWRQWAHWRAVREAQYEARSDTITKHVLEKARKDLASGPYEASADAIRANYRVIQKSVLRGGPEVKNLLDEIRGDIPLLQKLFQEGNWPERDF